MQHLHHSVQLSRALNTEPALICRRSASSLGLTPSDSSEWSEEGGSRPGPDASAGLLVPDGDGFLLFQIPLELKWDDATAVAFAEGVNLTWDAEPAQG